MIKRLNDLYLKTPALFRYMFNSCVVTVIDVVIVWILVRIFGVEIVIANTIGVVAGFLLDYLLSVFYVFDEAKGKDGFAIYLGTFLFGLVLADLLIYIGSVKIFQMLNPDMNFLFSKGLSIVVPFFILYYLRMGLYKLKQRRLEGKVE